MKMNKDSQVYISYIASQKEREAAILLLTVDRYMTYSKYKKQNVEYGYINEAAFNKLKRNVQRGTADAIASQSKQDVLDNYKIYLTNLKAKREEDYKTARRKLKECNDMIKYLEDVKL